MFEPILFLIILHSLQKIPTHTNVKIYTDSLKNQCKNLTLALEMVLVNTYLSCFCLHENLNLV
jgi:hypothetical protein